MKIKPLHWRRVSSRPFTIASPCLHTVLIIFLLGLPPITLHSAVINGTVLNQNTQRYLERATVEVEGTSLRTLTNKDGTYRLAGVPAGTHTIIARYTELDATSRTVTVTAEETTRLDFELTSDKIYRLGEFVVTSSVEGMAFAVNQQRRAADGPQRDLDRRVPRSSHRQPRRVPEERRGRTDGLFAERAAEHPYPRFRSEPHDGDNGRQRNRLDRLLERQPCGADRPALHREHRERRDLQGPDSVDVRQRHRRVGEFHHPQRLRAKGPARQPAARR